MVIDDGHGKAARRKISVKDSQFSCEWDSPPLARGKTNRVYAALRGGEEPIDRSMAIEVPADPPNYDHVWLRVKGKQIVTSPKARGGERPFVAVGIGQHIQEQHCCGGDNCPVR